MILRYEAIRLSFLNWRFVEGTMAVYILKRSNKISESPERKDSSPLPERGDA